jgi:mitochondrial cardiolipin hydrolase
MSQDFIANLKASLHDTYLSKSEKSRLKDIIGNGPLDPGTINQLRNEIHKLATEQVTAANFQMVMQWVKEADQLLMLQSIQQSRAYFSPGEECRDIIIQQINLALHQLRICVFTISDDHISGAIANAFRKGVDIRIITDNDKSFDHGSDIERLADVGIAIRADLTRNHMHHKFMVVDEKSVITGSYNWTSSAAKFNHENILLTREGGIVNQFTDEFDKLWSEMTEYR